MGTTTSRVISGVQYDDLTPVSTWEEEDAAHNLLVILPDFKMDQLRITYAPSTSTVLRVTGETQVAPTKWVTVDQNYAVPPNCQANYLVKFENGILRISFPKSTLPKQHPKLQEAATTVAPQEATTGTAPPATPKAATSTPPPTNNNPTPPRTTTEGEELKGVHETGKPDVPRAHSPKEVLKEAEPRKVQEEPAPFRPSLSPPPPKVDVLVKEKEENASKKRKEELEETCKKRTESPPSLVPLDDYSRSIKTGKESSTSGTVKEEEEEEPSHYCKEELKGVDETRKLDVPRAPSPREVLKEEETKKVQEEPASLRPSPSPPPSKLDGLVKEKEENASKERKEKPEEKRKKQTESPPPSEPLHDYSRSTKTGKESSTLGTHKEEEKEEPSRYCKEELKGVDETRKPDVPRAPYPWEVLKEEESRKVQEEPAPLRPSSSTPPTKVDGLLKEKEENASKEIKEEPEDKGKKRTESPAPLALLHGDSGSTKTGKESLTSGTFKEKEEKKKPSYYCKEEPVNGILPKEVKKRVATAAKEAVKGLAMAISKDRQWMVNTGVAVVVIFAVGPEDGVDEVGPEGAGGSGSEGVSESVEGNREGDLACIVEIAVGECPMDVVHSVDEVVVGLVGADEDLVGADYDGLDLGRRLVGGNDPMDPDIGEGLGLGGGEEVLIGEVNDELDAGAGEGLKDGGVGVVDCDTFHFPGFEKGHHLRC